MKNLDKKEKKINFKPLLDIAIAILAVALTAVASSLFVKTDTEWYNNLVKPDFNPQPIVFMIAWTIVYALTAAVIAIGLIKGAPKKILILIFSQLALQILWCLLFFTLYMPGAALAVLALLLAANLLIEIWLMKWNETAAWLYVFPIAWFAFATALNYAILMLN